MSPEAIRSMQMRLDAALGLSSAPSGAPCVSVPHTGNRQDRAAAPKWRSRWSQDTDIAAALESGGFSRALAGPDFDRLVSAARLVLDGEYRGIILHGAPGSGKSLAASILAPGLLDRIPALDWSEEHPRYPVPAVRVDCVNLPLLDKESRNDICLAKGAAFWVEDMGIEDPLNEFGVRVDPVAMLLSNIRPDTPMIITANLERRDPASGNVLSPDDAIRFRYGDRAASRLCEGFIWLKFTSGDHRLRRMKVL